MISVTNTPKSFLNEFKNPRGMKMKKNTFKNLICLILILTAFPFTNVKASITFDDDISKFKDPIAKEYYASLDEDLQLEIIDNLLDEEYTNIDELELAFRENVILYSVYDASTNKDIYEILRSNNDLLQIDFNRSEALHVSACNKLRRELYPSISILKEIYEEAITPCITGGGNGSSFTPSISDSCGENLTWSLNENVLTISGSGDMLDFYNPLRAPWYEQRDNIQTVIIKDGITTIGANAFIGCTNVTSFSIPESVTYIGYGAFSNCFFLEKITLPSKITSISDKMFYACRNLKELHFSGNIKSIGSYAFYLCSNLTELKIPDTVTTIYSHAFEGCTDLKNVSLPSGLTAISDYMFYDCQMLTLTDIPDTLSTIGKYAFYNCLELTNMNIPDTVKHIDSYAFANCFNIESIDISENISVLNEGTFYNCTKLNNVIIPDKVTSIGDNCFEGCTKLTDITFQKNISDIGKYAFFYCTNLKNINLPGKNTSIGEYAFAGCIRLDTLNILNTISIIDSYAFYNCNKLKTVYYYQPENTLNSITVGNENAPLADAYWHLVICTKTNCSKTPDYDVFSVVPTNIPVGSTIVFACFNDNQMVYLESRTYSEENPIYFVKFGKSDYDAVKIIVLESFSSVKPLCESETLKIN